MWSVAQGQHFRTLRKRAGFSQSELAKDMGYQTKQPIYYVESGKQEPSARFRIKALQSFTKRFPSIKMNAVFLDKG